MLYSIYTCLLLLIDNKLDYNFFLCSFINTFAYSLYCVNINPTYLQCAKLVRKLSSEVRILVMIKEKMQNITQRMLKKSNKSKSAINVRYKL